MTPQPDGHALEAAETKAGEDAVAAAAAIRCHWVAWEGLRSRLIGAQRAEARQQVAELRRRQAAAERLVVAEPALVVNPTRQWPLRHLRYR